MNSDLQRLAERLLNQGAGSLPERDQRVLKRIARRAQISRDLEREFSEKLTFGERLSDRVAEIGGSWGFIIGFGAFLIAWAILNTVMLATNAFDPYPYIFLNLLLSMIAAIQAPIIMMSQNRQAQKDRLAVSHDYEVNLKAEIEIMALHEKLDALTVDRIDAVIAAQKEQHRMLSLLLEKRQAD
ncbi:MAG: DUF1003 domain-containing protein [Rhabdaerophilum sp.]